MSGKTVVLTLARGIAADTADVTVDYAPPGTNPIRDLLGNKAAAFEDLAVTAVLVPNQPATGTVTVSGTATVGQTLTAAVSNVSDPAGLHAPPGYAYLWYRIDGTTETPIPGAESKTYTLAAPGRGQADQGQGELRRLPRQSGDAPERPLPGIRAGDVARQRLRHAGGDRRRHARADLDRRGRG